MSTFKCPLCASTMNKMSQTVYCDCGWHKSFDKKYQMKTQGKITLGLMVAGCLLIGVFFHLKHWSSFSLSIVPLKTMQWSGWLAKKSFTQLKTICMNLKKYDCVEEAYRSFFHSSADINILAQLDHFQYNRKKFNRAAKTYKKYFINKGNDIKTAYNYARILESKGYTDKALAYYQYAIRAEPHTIQVTIMRSYIDLLMKLGKVDRAKKELSDLAPLVMKSSSLVKQEYERWSHKVNG